MLLCKWVKSFKIYWTDINVIIETARPQVRETADVPAPMTTNYKAGTLEYLN